MSLIEDIQEAQRPRWLDWCEKNSQPKIYNIPRQKRELTRWQKRGPMTRRDWVRFYNWAAKNAIAHELEEPPPPAIPDTSPQKKKKKKTFAQLLERIAKLCVPRNGRSKYDYPPPPAYPYSPKIDFKKPANHDPGRPFPKPKVPRLFHHLELELDYWTKLRFPVERAALKYNISDNLLSLAQPRPLATADCMHCPIPEKPPEYVSPRKRMTYRQWVEHQRRLEYLAKPVVRPYYEAFCA